MEQKLVSIVVPIYKVEKYLDRCLRSIVNQSYQNLEIILVDDGSPDRCPEMCEAWAEKDSRIKVVHKQNAGLGMARNTGIEHASGEYICFFDSDDYVDERLVEKACERMARDNADIVVFGMANVDAHGRVIGERIPQTEKQLFEGDAVRTEFLPDLIDCSCNHARNREMTFSAWSCMYSMELIRRTQWRFVSERQNISEDSYSLIWLYRYVQRVSVLAEAMYYYCLNGASLTQAYREDRFDRCRQFYIDTAAMAAEQGHDEEVQRRIAGLFVSFTIAALKQIAAAEMKQKEKRARISRIVRDDQLRAALKLMGDDYASGAKGLICRAMRCGNALATAIMVYAKVLQEAKNAE